MTLSTVLVYIWIPFVLVTLYFGTRESFYNTDKYDGDGSAHKVLKWFNEKGLYAAPISAEKSHSSEPKLENVYADT